VNIHNTKQFTWTVMYTNISHRLHVSCICLRIDVRTPKSNPSLIVVTKSKTWDISSCRYVADLCSAMKSHILNIRGARHYQQNVWFMPLKYRYFVFRRPVAVLLVARGNWSYIMLRSAFGQVSWESIGSTAWLEIYRQIDRYRYIDRQVGRRKTHRDWEIGRYIDR
jgi:hypothetical protein